MRKRLGGMQKVIEIKNVVASGFDLASYGNFFETSVHCHSSFAGGGSKRDGPSSHLHFTFTSCSLDTLRCHPQLIVALGFVLPDLLVARANLDSTRFHRLRDLPSK